MKKRGMILLLALALTASATGCDSQTMKDLMDKAAGKEESLDTTAEQVTPEEDTEEAAKEDEEAAKALAEQTETEKYNAYIGVNNFMFDRLSTVIDGYFRRVEYQKEFKMNGTDYWCNSLGDTYYEIVDTAYDYSSKEPVFDKVDEAYQKLYPVLTDMMTTFDKIYNYGEMKDYLDDDYARAKKLHAKVWKQYNEYLELSEPFLNSLTEMADERQKETMEAFKEEGYLFRYSLMNTIQLGQKIQDFFSKNKITDANLCDTKLKKLKPIYKKFVASVKESYEFLSDSEQLEKEGIMSISTTMLESALKDVKVSITKIYKRIENNEPVEAYEVESAFPDEDTLLGFAEALGELIDEYNRLN